MEKVVLLLGPTGVGKTAISILLAKAFYSEIISADSMQIYRHMDIGTAKPSPEELQLVKHHMIDVAYPWESFSTGMFITMVRPVIDSLLAKGIAPIIAGGTGLYIKAMTRGIFTGPSADWHLRNDLLRDEELQPGSLYARLQGLDADAAAKIMPADTRRVIRALEVCLKSEEKLSHLHEKLTKPLPYDFLKIGLTRDRKELYGLIDQRVDLMMGQGLLAEVERVVKIIEANENLREGGPGKEVSSFTSMQAIGYKELVLYLNGATGLEETVALIKQWSRNYAKRQFTWFRKEEGIHWLDVTGIHDPHAILKKVMEIIVADK